MDKKFNDSKQQRQLAELRAKEAEDLAILLSNRYQLSYIDLTKIAINSDALRLITEQEARAGGIAPFKINGKQVMIAVISPAKDQVKKFLQELKEKNYQVKLYVCSELSANKAWSYYPEISLTKKTEAGIIEISNEQIEKLLQQLTTVKDIEQQLQVGKQKELSGSGISPILEIILAGALATKASDIHLEPEENDLRLRYRLDGVLQDICHLPEKTYRQILSRIKLISGLKLNIKKTAQDGRLSVRVKNEDIEIRTSVIPSAYGESIVLRLLNPKNLEVSFEDLGVETKLLTVFEREIRKPNGLILLTGPTGSGKTTTLYACLKKINSTESKIITIEDPIEYHIKGINQTQVNRDKDYTFLSGLRSALRQDPDVIMVGEIRDSETASIAVNASLTGHLVFSTLHTNNAAGAIPRLIDLKVNPKIISSALSIAIAQRLVRVLCPHCVKQEKIGENEQHLLTEILSSIAQKRPELSIKLSETLATPVGCPSCNYSGYLGRIGIFEAIYMDDNIAKLCLGNPGEKELRQAASSQAFLTMREDGVLKVLAGQTSLTELARVVDLEEE